MEASEPKKLVLADILKLAETLEVKAVDLSRAGKSGVTYVRELRQGEREVAQRLSGRLELKRGSTYIDARSLPQDAARQIVKMAWVTDETGQVKMWDQLVANYSDGSSRGNQRQAEVKAEEFLQNLPGAVVSLLVEEIRLISRLGEDEAEDYEEEKKES
jgi:hypothetical protein